ncbi:hypothetical protein ACQ4PT_044814 [Festuca glaucescens]
MEQYQQNDFLKFSLHPDPEDDYQAKEWGKFMYYLRENKKAGVVEFRSITFYILAPGSHSYSAEVFYETVLKDPGVCRKMAGKSGFLYNASAMLQVALPLIIPVLSMSFLSQSFNESKTNLEIPVVAYCKKGQYMEFDLNVQSEAAAEYNLNAIKDYSPFNEYVIGEKVPLDYSLKAYPEVIFLNPQMKVTIQGSPVITCHLEKSLDKRSVISDEIMGRTIHLTLGRSDVEWGRVNCGVFLYWHGRLIESYKRVGGQKHNAVTGRGIIGVADLIVWMMRMVILGFLIANKCFKIVKSAFEAEGPEHPQWAAATTFEAEGPAKAASAAVPHTPAESAADTAVDIEAAVGKEPAAGTNPADLVERIGVEAATLD